MADTDISDRLEDVSNLIHSFLTLGLSKLKEVVQGPQSTGYWTFNDPPRSGWGEEVSTWAEAMTQFVANAVKTTGWTDWTNYKSDMLFLRVTNHEMVDFLLPGVAKGTDQSGKEATARPKPIALAEDEELGSDDILLIAIPRLHVTEQSVAAAKTAIGELTASTQNGSRYTSGVVGDTQGAQSSHPSDPQNPGVRGQMAGSRTTDSFNSGVDPLGPDSGAFRVKQEEGSGDRVELRDIPDGSENEDNRPQGTEYFLMGPSASVRPTFRASFFDYTRTAKGVGPKQEAQDSNDPVKVETSEAA